MLSNIYQRYKDKIRFDIDINKATYFIGVFFSFDLIKNKKMVPTIGKIIRDEIIGKSISL